MRKQRGVSVSGLIVALIVVVVVALVGFKVFTPYVQYFEIQKIFREMAANPELQSGNRRAILSSWSRYSEIDGIETLRNEDVEVTNDSGGIVISAHYQVTVPLAGNVSLLLDFNPSSQK